MERRTTKRVIGTGIAVAVGGFIFANIEPAPNMSPSGDVVASMDTEVGDVHARIQYTDDGRRYVSYKSPTITQGSVDATIDSCDGTTHVHNSEDRTEVAVGDKIVSYNETRTRHAPICKDERITPADFAS